MLAEAVAAHDDTARAHQRGHRGRSPGAAAARAVRRPRGRAPRHDGPRRPGHPGLPRRVHDGPRLRPPLRRAADHDRAARRSSRRCWSRSRRRWWPRSSSTSAWASPGSSAPCSSWPRSPAWVGGRHRPFHPLGERRPARHAPGRVGRFVTSPGERRWSSHGGSQEDRPSAGRRRVGVARPGRRASWPSPRWAVTSGIGRQGNLPGIYDASKRVAAEAAAGVDPESLPHDHADPATKNALSRGGEVGKAAQDPTNAAERAIAAAYVAQARRTPDPPLTSVRPVQKRLLFPQDRYAMANGCYRMAGKPTYFKATDLGTYLLYTKRRKFRTADGLAERGERRHRVDGDRHQAGPEEQEAAAVHVHPRRDHARRSRAGPASACCAPRAARRSPRPGSTSAADRTPA